MWPENWPIVLMWRRVANGDGLNYGIIPWLFDEVYKVEDKAEMFESLQLMERSYLACKAGTED